MAYNLKMWDEDSTSWKTLFTSFSFEDCNDRARRYDPDKHSVRIEDTNGNLLWTNVVPKQEPILDKPSAVLAIFCSLMPTINGITDFDEVANLSVQAFDALEARLRK